MASDKVEERGEMRLMHLEVVGQAGRRKRGQQLLPVAGFTLIEVVIVMAVVAILTAIAIPNYFQFIARGHRSEARATLTQAAQWMERWRTERGTYNGAALPATLARSPATGTQMYAITVATAGNTYTLTAAPQGPMTGDPCGDFGLDNTGQRTRSGTEALDICWGR